jgi:oxaloacetate decarboxylase gamma subunit
MMSSLLQRFFPDAPASQMAAAASVSSGIDKSIIAAITAAVHQHRNKRKQR